MCSHRAVPPLDHRRVPVSLDEVARRTAALWAVEPPVTGPRRTELLSALSDLEADIDAIQIRHVAGADIHPTQVRRCAQRYLRLRDDWGDEAAA